MPTEFDFRDCPHCGKSIRTNASICYRCQAPVELTPHQSASQKFLPLADDDKGTEHGALAYGGYDGEEGDFEYDEYVQDEFSERRRRRPFTWYVTWLLILSFLLPVLLNVLQLLQDR